MGLLLLLHLGSGLLHPCCLGGTDGEHVGMHAASETGAEAQGPVHAAAGHSEPGDRPSHESHTGAGEDAGHEDCEGTCGLCCSTVDQVVLATPTAASVQQQAAPRSHDVRPVDAVLPPTPAYLLPPANAPPGSLTLLG